MRASFGVGSLCVTVATNAGLSAGFSRAAVDGNIFDERTLARIPTWFSYLAMATLGIQESNFEPICYECYDHIELEILSA